MLRGGDSGIRATTVLLRRDLLERGWAGERVEQGGAESLGVMMCRGSLGSLMQLEGRKGEKKSKKVVGNSGKFSFATVVERLLSE